MISSPTTTATSATTPASAVETYARAAGLADEAVRAASTLQLRAAVALGRMMPAQPVGRGKKLLPDGNSFRPDERSRLRTLAANVDAVERAIADAPTDKLSTRSVLSRIERQRRQEVDDDARRVDADVTAGSVTADRWAMHPGDLADVASTAGGSAAGTVPGMTTITSQPLTVDLDLYAGDDTVVRVTASSPTGGRVDLTGTYQCEVRTTAAGLVGAAEVDPVDAASGVLAVRFDHDLTGQLAGVHVWDLEWTDPAGFVTTLAAGTLRTIPDVSRPAVVVAAAS